MQTMKGLLMAAVAACSACAAFADGTFYWTGTVDNRWDNPANWEDEGGQTPAAAPGVIWDGVTGDPAEASGDTAVFGSSAYDTIDLSNLYSVSNVTVTADAPTLTFGTAVSNTQVLPFEPGGNFVVQEGAPAPVISALGTQANVTHWKEDSKTLTNYATTTVDNQSSGQPKILSLGYVRRRPGSLKSWFLSQVNFRGNGCEIAGDAVELDSATYAFTLYDAGTYTVSADTTTAKIQVSGGAMPTINIAAGVTLKFYSDLNTQGFFLSSKAKLVVNGPGKVVIRDKDNANSYSNRGAWSLTSDTGLTLNCPIEVRPRADKWDVNPTPQITLGTSIGFVAFRNEGNVLPGPISHVGDSAVEVIFSDVAALGGCPGFVFGSKRTDSNRGWISYDGAGEEELAGYLAFTNVAHFGAQAKVAGAELTLSSEIRTDADGVGTGSDFRVYGYPGRVVYNCTLADAASSPKLVFAGWPDDGGWGVRLTTDAQLPAAGVTLDGAKLAVDGSGRTLPPLTVVNKNSQLIFSGPSTNVLTAVDVQAENRTLDIVTDEGAVVKFAGANVHTEVPARVTMNGKTARFTVRGELTTEAVTIPDVEIGAKGAVVVEDEEKIVGITSEGTEGNNRLDSSFVLVKGLVQQSEWPSTLALGADDGLAADFVGIDPGGAALTVGDTAGVGRLGTEALFNGDKAPLTVNAPLESTSLKTSGKGEIVLRGGMKEGYSIAAMTNTAGVLRLAAGEYVTANDDAFIALNGGRTIIESGAVLRRADNALATGKDARDAQIQVGHAGIAVLEIEPGAVVSNQITTCRTQSSGNANGYPSAVYMHGGTVYNTPGKSQELRMIGGNGYSYGFWGMDAGTLGLAKEVMFGNTTGVGIYQQTGGALLHTSGNIRLGAGGVAMADWFQSGGTSQFAGIQIPYSNTTGNKMTSFTVTGEGTQMIAGEGATGVKEVSLGIHNLVNAAETNAYVWCNVNDGARLVAATICRNGLHRNHLIREELWDTNKVFLNVDGGIIQFAATWGTDAFGSFANGKSNGVDRVTIYKGGLTMHTETRAGGAGHAVTMGVPFRGATGQGVQSVEWVDRPELEMVGSPYVWIIGDGEGASAHAYFDMRQRKVTEVRVTSPGVNYTWAKAVFQYKSNWSGSRILWTNDVVLAENEIDGGLKVSGYGTVAFEDAEFPGDYRGPTEITGSATLRTLFDNAINPASKLILNGGTLDLRNHAQTFSDVETLAETYMRNGKPKVAGLTADLAAAVAGRPKSVNLSQFDFAPGAKLVLTNVDKAALDRTQAYTVVSFSALPTTLDMSDALAQVPADWNMKLANNALVMTAKRPMAIILR